MAKGSSWHLAHDGPFVALIDPSGAQKGRWANNALGMATAEAELAKHGGTPASEPYTGPELTEAEARYMAQQPPTPPQESPDRFAPSAETADQHWAPEAKYAQRSVTDAFSRKDVELELLIATFHRLLDEFGRRSVRELVKRVEAFEKELNQ